MKMTTSVNDRIAESIEKISRQHDRVTIGESCSLEIEADGTLILRTEHPEETGICETIYNGVTRCVSLPTGVRPASLAKFLKDHISDLETIVNGMDSYWDDSRHVGTITDEAKTALISIVPNQLLHYPDVEVIEEMDVDEYFKTYYEDTYHEIRNQEKEEDAVALALENLDENGIDREMEVDTDFVLTYIGRREAEDYAREIWRAARSENDDD